VLVAAHATLLGNIRVGDGAIVQAGSLVLKDVEAHTRVAGIPAKEVGTVSGKPALEMTQLNVKEEKTFCDTWGEAVREAVRAEGGTSPSDEGERVTNGVSVSARDGEVTFSFGRSIENGRSSSGEEKAPVPAKGQEGPEGPVDEEQPPSSHTDLGCGI